MCSAPGLGCRSGKVLMSRPRPNTHAGGARHLLAHILAAASLDETQIIPLPQSYPASVNFLCTRAQYMRCTTQGGGAAAVGAGEQPPTLLNQRAAWWVQAHHTLCGAQANRDCL